MLTLSLLLSCGTGGPSRFLDCPDSECQLEWLLAHPEDISPERLSAFGELEQMILVEHLIKTAPSTLESLCGGLGSAKARARCETTARRPHLWEAPAPNPAPGTTNEQKVTAELLSRSAVTSPLFEEPGELVPCPDERVRVNCQTAAAKDAARQRAPGTAARACLALPDSGDQAECFFQAADDAFNPQRKSNPGSLWAATELCLASGLYRERCLGHITWDIGNLAPPSDTPDPESWTEISTHVRDFGAALNARTPGLEVPLTDRAWARAMYISAHRAQHPAGHPLDSVPADVAPQLRMATAWLSWSRHEGPPQSSAAWIADVETVLASRTVGSGDKRRSEPTTVPNLWLVVKPTETSLAWQLMLGDGRRAVSRDAQADTLICLMEAVGRAPRDGGRDIFTTALAHDDEVVRWTAVRLLGGDLKTRLGIELPEEDPSPLVQARISPT